MALTTRRISRHHKYRPRVRRLCCDQLEDRLLLTTDFYAIDGAGNNLQHLDYGAADIQLLRTSPVDYENGIETPAGEDRPSARLISNAVAAQTASHPNDRWMTDFVWQWGQFLDHDIDLTEAASPPQEFPIEIPTGDPYFDPTASGTEVMELLRSTYDPATGTSRGNPRQQVNDITGWVDGSQIYGSDIERAAALRTLSGGRMQTGDDDLLPLNVLGLPNAPAPTADFFLAGDVRANENVGLTALHTLFVREHNRLADEIVSTQPALSDEAVFQQARQAVIGQLQSITYNEFLPTLLGHAAIPDYNGYDPHVQPDIANVFATAAYRLGHSMLSPELLRLDAEGQVVPAGNLPLRDAFFAPHELMATGIEPILAGLGAQRAQEIDNRIVDDVRNFLFGLPGAGGFDLASLNIQRGRDHGLPSYNEVRSSYGLPACSRFDQISSDPLVQDKLQSVYGRIHDIDVWVGGLAEDHLRGGSVGELFSTILVDQFSRLRDGDRLWYQQQYQNDELWAYENTTLADVIRRNTSLVNMRDALFYDQSVLYYRTPAGSQGADLTIKLQHGEVVVVDNGTSMIVASVRLAHINRIVLVGSSRHDSLSVLSGIATLKLAGGIEFHGMDGDDHLSVEATNSPDQLVVRGAAIDLNGHTLSHSGWERLTMFGLAGNDSMSADHHVPAVVVLAGGPDHDILTGGSGHDELLGGWGSDQLRGGDGDDYLDGGPGNDILEGGDGFDQLYGGADVDTLHGGDHDDRLFGGLGPDTLYGEPGHDALDGGDGIDNLYGGNGDDLLTEYAGYSHVVGGRGSDRLSITGTSGSDLLISHPNYGQLTSHQGLTTWSEIEHLTVYGMSGHDRAFLYDSSRNDIASGSKSEVSMSADNGAYANVASGFEHVVLSASGGRNDRVYFSDSWAQDILVARPDYSIWHSSVAAYYLQANAFESVFATSSHGGRDTAYFDDAPGNDVYTGTPTSGLMRDGSYYNSASGFDRYRVDMTAGGSKDKAYLYDSAGDDVFLGDPEVVSLHDVARTYQHTVKGAERVYAYATAGGYDTAELTGSVGNDTFRDYATAATLKGRGYYLYTSDFESVHVDAAQGYDELYLYHVPNEGYLYGIGNYVDLTAPHRFRTATNWDYVKAVAKSGHRPTYELHDVDYVFRAIGDWRSGET